MSVFEEVSKYNVQLNVVERLWAVRSNLSSPGDFPERAPKAEPGS